MAKDREKAPAGSMTATNGPIILAILDGWGIAPPGPGNAIKTANTPNMDRYAAEYPTTHLMAHGRYVGLLPDQEGNSEAGHMNIGAGRVVRQDIVIVSEAIRDRTFFKKMAFKEAVKHARKHKSKVHIMGLLSNGNSAHSCPEHLHALLKFIEDEGVEKVRLHLFTDGRDSKPRSARKILRKLEEHMSERHKISSICGRFYGMDRNKFWDRTEKAYNTIVGGEGLTAPDAHAAVLHGYDRGESDEFIQPTVIVDDKGKPTGKVEDDDVIIFFNLRSDRARQMAKVFIQRDFEKNNKNSFRRKFVPKNMRFVAMSDFGPDLEDMYTAFPSRDVQNSLTAVLSSYRQFYIAESEKYAHVTFFFNGGYADILHGEERMKVPSMDVVRYEEYPEMRAEIIADEVIRRVESGLHDFVALNFANADMTAHSGNMEQAAKAVEIVDTQLGKLAAVALKKGGHLIVTADHGNAESMKDPEDESPVTEHSANPVPFHMVSEKFKRADVGDGMLGDVAPTILDMLDIPKPPEMTGFSLIRSK